MEVSSQTLSECLGVTQRAIRDLAKNGIAVRVKHGIYDLGITIQNYIEWKISCSKTSNVEKSLEQVKTEHEELKMRKTELVVRHMEGKLHKADDVERIWTNMAAAVKSKLLSIPIKTAPQIVGIEDIPEIQKLLVREITEALNEVASYDPTDYADTAPLEDDSEEGEEDESED